MKKLTPGSSKKAGTRPPKKKASTRTTAKPRVKARQVAAARKPAAAEVAAVNHHAPRIVGVGASAGGLEAFTQLLQALPLNTGMAYVLVQHLEPTHESVLPKLLARTTKMPVEEARHGMRVLPNHVYVIPSNADLSLSDGVFRVVVRMGVGGHYLPIDSFFSSLAETQLSNAIGVVLSGTASDGTAGLRAIKLRGGLTFAQDPSTAKFDGMPRSAITSGCVDFVLSPERIATEIGRLAFRPLSLVEPAEVPPPKEEHWAHLFRLLRTSSGVDFSNYKKATVKRRIARRMGLHKFEDFGDYLKFLEANRAELDLLFQEILIHVTGFFRDPEVFVALKEKIFPQILDSRPAGEPVRIWVSGCSTGEEAYSIAICLLEYLGDRASSIPILIFATDINELSIDKARSGLYSAEVMRDVSAERKRRFFTQSDGNFTVNPAVRERCVFARHDLIKDPPFSKLDLVSCRNVLIYLEPVLQKQVLAAFHYSLKGKGMLLLGRSESLGAFRQMFSTVDRKNKFFMRDTGAGEPLEIVESSIEAPPRSRPRPEAPLRLDLEREADRIVWERYTHAGIVVNNDLQILHFRGDTAPYLQPAPGRATFNLSRMLPQELQLELRAALQEARRSGHSVRREGIPVRNDGQMRTVNLEVVPLPGSNEGGKCFLILFEEDTLARRSVRGKSAAAAPLPTGRRAGELRKVQSELVRTREYLQAVIREQESTNEELKTANEEALSSMEELQSTNEELETAKEELQSSNEELVTLNEQLQNRNTELSLLSDDLTNVISGVDIPILILDRDRRIRRFTPPTQKLLGLLATDIGRPLGNLRVGLNIPDLNDLISSVAEHESELSREVQSDDGRWYMMRMRPFRTAQEKIEGVVIVFTDIHDLKQQQNASQTQETLVSAILDSASDLLVMVLDHEGRIVQFNSVCQRSSGYSLEEVRGRKPWEFLVLPAEQARLKETFGQVLHGGSSQTETHWVAKDGHRLLIAWSNRGVKVDGVVETVIATGTDRTESVETRQKAVESEATVRALLETAAQAIMAVNREGKIVLVNAASEKMFAYTHDEMIGMDLGLLLPQRFRPRHMKHMANFFAQPAPRQMGAGLELAGLRHDGSEFPVEISLSYISANDGTIAVAFISDITERKRSQGALLDYQKQLQNLSGNLLTLQESGNRELARELHDVFSQELAGLNLEVADLWASAHKPEVLTKRLRELGQKIARLADEMHRTSRRLHPAIIQELGLEAALREECERFSKQLGVPIRFSSEQVPARLPDEVSLCVYRVGQESLHNIGKHAQATEVNMQLRGSPEGIRLRIEDKGNGFDVSEARKSGGLGLISMEERVRLANGKLDIQSQPGAGTIVELFVPVNFLPVSEDAE